MAKIDRQLIVRLIATIEGQSGQPPRDVIAFLIREEAAVHRHNSGTEELKMAKVTATCTAGGAGLLNAWCRRARIALERENG